MLCRWFFSLIDLFRRCGIISFISIAFIAVTFAIHLPISILLDDVCYAIYTGLHGGSSTSFSSSTNSTDSGLDNILHNCFSTGSYFPGFDDTFSFTSELLVALNDSSTQVLSYSFDPTLTSASKSLDDIITQTVSHIQGILIEVNNRAGSVRDIRMQDKVLTVLCPRVKLIAQLLTVHY